MLKFPEIVLLSFSMTSATKVPGDVRYEESFEEDDFDLQEGDIISKTIDGVRAIQYSPRVYQLVSQSMDKTVAKKGDDLMDDEIDYAKERDQELENDVAE
ncbi:hypothetical protein PVK06_027967 [Gossypium arboreum]|uniref:Uncharacterized protein n=1 Tax=Gossypium arboreum TaxID=29729 RepID=A0ABR0P3Y7_GOSAR|nr:hypothetical protein PVK06_027967 [Gossypium arboreum]